MIVSNLKINKLTQVQYDAALAAGNINENEFYITPENKNQTIITIPAGRMRGDIDGDGKITQADVDLISAHYNGETLLINDVQLSCADINGDGSIKAIDITICTLQCQ